LSWLSNLFGGRSKAVQAPQVTIPSVGGYEQYPTLQEFAMGRISGKTAGFGEDFLNRATNAPIASREARFRDEEVPFLNSQLSARGVGRSGGTGLATDVMNRASLQKERDIQDLMSQFYVLNEAQKKTDTSEGVRVSEGLLDRQANRATQQAGLDAGLNATNAGLKANADTAQREGINKLIATALGGAAGMAGVGATSALSGAATSFSGNPQANIAGIPSSSLSGMSVEQLLALIGGR